MPEFYTIGPLPFISIFGAQVPSYYLVISLAYCVAILWFYKRCESKGLNQKIAMDLGMILMISGFVGARLLHVLFEAPEFYFKKPSMVLQFWQGGYVFYGGFLAAYALGTRYVLAKKEDLWAWKDALAPIVAFGYAMGRVACFLTGCCYGKVCELPWAVGLKQVDLHSHAQTTLLRHPTQLYATLFELIVLGYLLIFERRKPKPGVLFFTWLALHGGGRLMMEVFRDDPRGEALLGLSISSWISLALIILAIVGLRTRLLNTKAPAL